MKINFTSTERVLWKATYEHAINVLKLSDLEAREKAMNKIISKRALAGKVSKH